MIYRQTNMPIQATAGDAWTDGKSFKRVLSRGGAWENVNLGEKHCDEVEHEQSTQPKAEQRLEDTEVPSGTGESTPGDGDNRETVSEPSGDSGPEDTSLTAPDEEGVDANGSPVVS
jgi:hypothetical protein